MNGLVAYCDFGQSRPSMLKLATDVIYLWEHNNGGNGLSGLVTRFPRDEGNGELEKRLGFCWTSRVSLSLET